MIPRENYEALVRLNQVQENQIQKLRTEKRELELKIEILKKYSILGEIINEKKFICNLR